MSGRLAKAIGRNKTLQALADLKGNTRWCVYCEPFWAIPYSLFSPFATLYMYRLGVTDLQIGILLTIGQVTQMCSTLAGGIITDRLGRRRTTFLFDFAAWTIPCLLWAVSQNFWWFAAVAMLNGLWQINNNSWIGLMSEDADPKVLPYAFTGSQMAAMMAVFLAPISSFFVSRYELVPVMRVLYFLSAFSMATKSILLLRKSVETRQGLRRMEETRGVPFWKLVLELKDVFRKIFRTPATVLILSIIIIVNILTLVTANFFSLFVTQSMGIPDEALGYIPIIRAAAVLIFMFGFQHLVNALPYRPVMITGMALYALAFACLVFFRVGYLGLALYILLEAVAFSFVMPRRDALLVLFSDKKERARVHGAVYAITMAVSAPFGSLLGYLSEQNRVYPFLLGIGLCGLCALMVLLKKVEVPVGDPS
jgi:MFS family permease